MNLSSNKKIIWAALFLAMVTLSFGYLFSSFLTEYNQLKAGEELVLFSGLDVFFYFILAAWAVGSAYWSPDTKFKKAAPVAILFILFVTYQIFYDSISFRFIDAIAKEHSYYVCLKKKKGPKGGFGSNYVLGKDMNLCNKFSDLYERSVTSRELEERVLQLKSQTK